MMNIQRLLINAVGVIVGGGLMYALVKKSGYEKHAKTLSSTLVEGGAITGGAFLGYHLSNVIVNRLVQEAPDKLPDEQAHSLPGGDGPVDTPSAEKAMGSVAAKAQAVNTTPTVSSTEVKGGQVIDISAARKNEV
jgi:hypothetical protein